MSNIYIYPNTSTIVSDTFKNVDNIVMREFKSKRSVLIINKHYEESVLYNFAFSTSVRGVFGSVIDMVGYARTYKISRYIHIRSCSEFADRNYSIALPELRIYAISKFISYIFAKWLCHFYKIKFNYIVLPLVLTKNSSWAKTIPVAIVDLKKADNFFARVLKQCELHTLDAAELLNAIGSEEKYTNVCLFNQMLLDADASITPRDEWIFLTIKNVIKYTPLNFLLSILVRLKLIPSWSLFYREAFYRSKF